MFSTDLICFKTPYNWNKYLHQQENFALILNRKNVSSQHTVSSNVSPGQVQLVQHLGQKNRKVHQGMQVSHDTHLLEHLYSERENLTGTVHDLENTIMISDQNMKYNDPIRVCDNGLFIIQIFCWTPWIILVHSKHMMFRKLDLLP